GNRQGAGFLIYRPRRPPQQIVAPRRRTPTPTTRIALAAIEPLLPGKREQLSYRVLGEYRHKGTISVRLTYVLLDPKQHPICATPRGLMRTGFVLCEPVQVIKAGVGRLYTERDVLERGHRTLQRVVPLRVKRPNYHLDRARLRGGVATGPVAYDQVRKRWILFDAKRSRSVTVAPNFPTTDLPGNWLALFTNLNSQHEVFLRWTAHTPQRAAAILQALRKASIRAEYFRHKGHRSDRTLTVVVTRRTIDLLARVVREQRSALVGWSIAVVSMAKAPVGCLEPLGGAKRFCDGRVYPQGQLGHITWFAYHSPLTPAQLAARYLKACGRTNLEQQGTSYVWRFPVTRPTAVLSIGPTAERGPWYRCKLPASARSILSISHFPH
ncbi:MAG: hypothetical protein KC609_03360, partial [Myxococcales bacterium]|nr:hypothetical protein [Myxococcales bacterium]